MQFDPLLESYCQHHNSVVIPRRGPIAVCKRRVVVFRQRSRNMQQIDEKTRRIYDSRAWFGCFGNLPAQGLLDKPLVIPRQETIPSWEYLNKCLPCESGHWDGKSKRWNENSKVSNCGERRFPRGSIAFRRTLSKSRSLTYSKLPCSASTYLGNKFDGGRWQGIIHATTNI